MQYIQYLFPLNDRDWDTNGDTQGEVIVRRMLLVAR
jgi:hypothetical protein